MGYNDYEISEKLSPLKACTGYRSPKNRSGNLIGAIIGDIVGSRFEFDNHRNKDFELFSEECFATDDSIMTLCVAKAIMDAGVRDDAYFDRLKGLAVKYMREIGRNYPDCGYGKLFYDWVFGDDAGSYNSYGNGAAMRVSPAGFAGTDESDAKAISKCVTCVTHDSPEGRKGAEATTIAIYMALMGCTKEEIRERIHLNYYPLDFTIDGIRATYTFNETCQGTVPQAIEAFLESDSFEDAIRTAISVGGDSDTLAAITGGIAEAYYGVPDDLRETALSYLDDELRDIYNKWIRFQFPLIFNPNLAPALW
jgi:ADP-ribosylglycohydrolase